MTTTIKSTRSLVSLGLPKSAPALLSFAESAVLRMTGNAHFPSPVPALASVSATVDDLRAAQAGTLSGLKGSVEARNAKRKALVLQLQQLRSYVQTVADADEANARVIIASSGFAVRKQTPRKARVFAAKLGPNSGVATVTAVSSGPRAAYEWQYSIDGGKTWVSAPPTVQARTTIAGFTPLTVVEFRYRAVTKSGAADWSAPVSLTVT